MIPHWVWVAIGIFVVPAILWLLGVRFSLTAH